MRSWLLTLCVILAGVLLTPSAQAVPAPVPVAGSTDVIGNSASNQLMFVANAGQFDKNVRFQVSGTGGTLFLTDDALWLSVLDPATTGSMGQRAELNAGSAITDQSAPRGVKPPALRGVNIKLSFVGANAHARLEPFDRLETKVSYFHGAKANWRAGLSAWAGVRYRDLYPGIDLELSGAQGKLQQVLRARPGADLGAVRLRIAGDDAHSVEGGQMRLHTSIGDLALPLIQLEANAGMRLDSASLVPSVNGAEISTPFVPLAGTAAATPQQTSDLIYSTFLGGSYDDIGWSVAADSSGASYVVGETFSPDFPSKIGAWDGSCGTDGTGKCNYNSSGNFYYTDAFVVKMNASGTERAYSTFLGGGRGDRGYGIAVDSTGAAYVTGSTYSADFPTNNAYDTTCGTDGNCNYYSAGDFYLVDGFVAKLSPNGSALEYATYLGGSDDEWGNAIAVDDNDSAYVTGRTYSYDFPLQNPYDDTCGSDGGCDFDTTNNIYPTDIFVSKFSADGSSLDYSTFLGGSYFDTSFAIAVDQDGAAYIAGNTVSTDFPLSNPLDDTCGTDGACNDDGKSVYYDGVVVKLLPDGSNLDYSTYFGGNFGDGVRGIAVDSNRAAYITGYTYSSSGFPITSGAYDKTFNGVEDSFAAKINAAGSSLTYGTYLGGTSTDYGTAIAIDGSNLAYVTGGTFSNDFPVTLNAYSPLFGGAEDVFMTKLNATGSSVPYSTFLGGDDIDEGYGIAVNGNNVYVGGLTSSANFPVSATAYDKSYAGNTCGADPNSHLCYDTFVTMLTPTTNPAPRFSRIFLPEVKAQVPALCDTFEPNDDRRLNPRQILLGTTYQARLCRNDQDNYYFDITRNLRTTITVNLPASLRGKTLIYVYAQTDLAHTLECPTSSPTAGQLVANCGVLGPNRYIVRLYTTNRDQYYDSQNFYSLRVTAT